MLMGNWRNAPYETLAFWSMKTALAFKDRGRRATFAEDEIVPSSDVRFDIVEQRENSPLLRVCAGQPETSAAYSFRFLRSFSRGSAEIRGNDWILCCEGGRSVVGRVGEMLELCMSGTAMSLVRMMLHEAREVSFEDESRGCVIPVPRDSPCGDHYVRGEHASLHELHCDVRQHELVFTYIY